MSVNPSKSKYFTPLLAFCCNIQTALSQSTSHGSSKKELDFDLLVFEIGFAGINLAWS